MKTAAPCILVLNGGSSSLKFALYSRDDELRETLRGEIIRIGQPTSTLTMRATAASDHVDTDLQAPDHASAMAQLMDRLGPQLERQSLLAVGHRVVHGGPRYWVPQRIDAPMLDELRRLCPLDPSHLPAEIRLIEAIRDRLPDTPQVACFDTAFHRDMPRVAQMLAIPRRYETQGLRRYGFHGLSCQYLMEALARIPGGHAASGRVVLAHLGSGASLTAVRDGRSIDTSMGFTPAAGVPMGTRAGDLDPGLGGFLARTEGMSAHDFERMINRESGLLGVSETSADIRDLLASEADDPRAAEAVALFCYQVRKWIGAFAAALGGLDTLVFSGGIGENAASIRARICADLGFLGIELDQGRNARSDEIISRDGAACIARIVRTDEASVIAHSVAAVLDAGGAREAG